MIGFSSRPPRLAAWIVVAALAAFAAACGRLDSEVRSDVEARLARDPETSSLHVAIAVRRGVVHLSGETRTRREQARAVELARGVEGVSDVENNMWLNDAVVVEAVKQALASDEMVGAIPIDVEARRGVVRLTSDATNRDERQRAVAIAKQVDGVTQVDDFMK
jgi:hyperosmotically inducible protein